MGAQNSIVYGVEGLRSVAEALLAGAVFVGTGNLAASFSGRVVSQVRIALAYGCYGVEGCANEGVAQ